jgi:hypothetical protein
MNHFEVFKQSYGATLASINFPEALFESLFLKLTSDTLDIGLVGEFEEVPVEPEPSRDDDDDNNDGDALPKRFANWNAPGKDSPRLVDCEELGHGHEDARSLLTLPQDEAPGKNIDDSPIFTVEEAVARLPRKYNFVAMKYLKAHADVFLVDHMWYVMPHVRF